MTARDSNYKMSEGVVTVGGGGGEERFNLDNILSELGSFGKYQLLLLLLLAFRDSFLLMCNFHYVFTAASVPHRCFVPECESPQHVEFNASWTRFALPNDSACHCHRLAPLPALPAPRCAPSAFDPRREQSCDKIVYQDYNSIVAEFDLGCSPWKGTMVGTVHNLGLILSNVILGLIADRYGRKVIIVGTPLMVGVLGLLKSFSVDYWMLLALEFLETALGYGNASLVLSLESVNQRSRVAYGCFSDSLASLGAASLGLIAWRVPYWRHLARAIYAPLLVVVFYIFLVDEGVRWLLAHNKREEAVRVLHKVAKVNNVTLSRSSQDMLRQISEKDKAEQTSSSDGTSHLCRALRSRAVAARMALMSACFFCCSFVYNGAIINATAVFGNKYLNVSAMLLVTIPTRLLLAVTLNRFGRKGPICVAYALCAVFFVTSAFVPKSTGWASTLLYVAGKMASSYGNFAVFVVAAEVFPTTARSSLINIANIVGRFGSVLAPQAPLLAKYMEGLPSVTFGLVALCACALALLLPETTETSLPDDVRDVEEPTLVSSSHTNDVEKSSGSTTDEKQPYSVSIIQVNGGNDKTLGETGDDMKTVLDTHKDGFENTKKHCCNVRRASVSPADVKQGVSEDPPEYTAELVNDNTKGMSQICTDEELPPPSYPDVQKTRSDRSDDGIEERPSLSCEELENGH